MQQELGFDKPDQPTFDSAGNLIDKTRKRILCFGGGVDSSAMLFKHLLTGCLNIDHVVFSDTGAEKKETYNNVNKFKGFCESQNIPFNIVTHHKENLTEWLLRNGTLPLLPQGASHLCSVKFKAEVIQRFLTATYPDTEFTMLIGIEADEGRRSARFTKPKNDTNEYEYPLQEWGWTRQICLDYLEKMNLKVVKSSCVYCPFMKEDEIREVFQDKDQWNTVKQIEHKFRETSPAKHQRWIDAGKPLIQLKTKNKDGSHKTRAPAGMWKADTWKSGGRLFTSAKIDGKKVSVDEWEEKLKDE